MFWHNHTYPNVTVFSRENRPATVETMKNVSALEGKLC